MTISRRDFIRYLTTAGLLGTAGFPMQGASRMFGASGGSDYKALVCLFLYGGNDSWNTLIPTSTHEFNSYWRSRGEDNGWSLALPKSTLLPLTLDGSAAGDPSFGLHPSMQKLSDLFHEGKVAFLPNVGPLIKPTSKDDYQDYLSRSHPLPPQLFSHNDQQAQWESLRGRAFMNSGWAGRMADAMQQSRSSQLVPINISLAGQTIFQTGNTTLPLGMAHNGPGTLEGLTDGDRFVSRRRNYERFLRSVGHERSLYEQSIADLQLRMIDYSDLLGTVYPGARSFAALPDSGEGLSYVDVQLRTVAKMISIRNELNMSRQVFLVSMGGFDSHDNQMKDQPALLGMVSSAITSFTRAMEEMGLSEQVTTFTQSDFGRTLTSNGTGSDHGWGGTCIVAGGAVNGGRLYGDYPLLELNTDEEIGGGIFIPSYSSDQYVATLAKWFGVSDFDLPSITPSLSNFDQKNLGFMKG